MTPVETQQAYDLFVVPESRNIPRSSTGSGGAIDFKKPHAPLLFIAGERDHNIPSSPNNTNYKAYKEPSSTCDLKEFPGRTHFICGQPGSEEVAQYVEQWISKLK
jgi:alpha-beta hydrolase superfamily lysophospholipase